MIIADAHVHLYNCFDLQVFFDSALQNFNVQAERLGYNRPFTGVLMLTESSNDAWFRELLHYAGKKKIGNWSFNRNKEQCSITALQDSGQSLCLMAGRQIVTEENLEVLALGTEHFIADGASLGNTIQETTEHGAIPAIPWGTGKWFGRRGRILKIFLTEKDRTHLFLGDNGGRPTFWPRPSLFQFAESRGIRVLPGSDPLPFHDQQGCPGRYGFTMDQTLSSDTPATDLKQLLRDPKIEIKPYGRLEKPLRFFRNQLRMQIVKHKRRSPQNP